MNSEKAKDTDQLLNQALLEWRVDDPLPPRFGERVWQRIAREEAQAPATAWRLLANWITNAMARPSLAASYLALLLLTGVAAGHWHARVDSARTTETLASRYVQMIDPYKATHH